MDDEHPRHHLGLDAQKEVVRPAGRLLIGDGLGAQLRGQGLGLGRCAVGQKHLRAALYRRPGQSAAHVAGSDKSKRHGLSILSRFD